MVWVWLDREEVCKNKILYDTKSSLIFQLIRNYYCLKWASWVAQVVRNLPAMWETWVWSLGREGRSPGEGHGNPLQYSFLENPMDRGVWQATVHGVAKSQTRLSDKHFRFTLLSEINFNQTVTIKRPDIMLNLEGRHLWSLTESL